MPFKLRLNGKNRKIAAATLAILAALLLFVFQNCSGGFQGAANLQSEIALSAAGPNPDGSPNYTWVGTNWGTCSNTCGGGTQTRTVQCQDSSSKVVSDSLCSSSKPASSQACNPQACALPTWTQLNPQKVYFPYNYKPSSAQSPHFAGAGNDCTYFDYEGYDYDPSAKALAAQLNSLIDQGTANPTSAIIQQIMNVQAQLNLVDPNVQLKKIVNSPNGALETALSNYVKQASRYTMIYNFPQVDKFINVFDEPDMYIIPWVFYMRLAQLKSAGVQPQAISLLSDATARMAALSDDDIQHNIWATNYTAIFPNAIQESITYALNDVYQVLSLVGYRMTASSFYGSAMPWSYVYVTFQTDNSGTLIWTGGVSSSTYPTCLSLDATTQAIATPAGLWMFPTN